MANSDATPGFSDPSPLRLWGLWAVLCGGIALALVSYQIFGPPSGPQPSVGQQIGEIAGEMKRSAWRSLLGMEPEAAEPLPEPTLFEKYGPFAGPALGIFAIVLSVISLMRRENWRLAAYGTAMGTSAVAFLFIWWMALLIAGIVLLVSIIENLGEFFSFGWPWE